VSREIIFRWNVVRIDNVNATKPILVDATYRSVHQLMYVVHAEKALFLVVPMGGIYLSDARRHTSLVVPKVSHQIRNVFLTLEIFQAFLGALLVEIVTEKVAQNVAVSGYV
jgi:hypothetical protein